MMQNPCAGAALDPPLWTVVPNKALFLSLSLSLSLSRHLYQPGSLRERVCVYYCSTGVCVFITAVPYYATALDIEDDPQRRRFGCRESDFALQRLVECCALEYRQYR